MAEISRFYGIIIQMYGNDHAPAHFHVTYNEYRAKIEIETGNILEGNLPARQLKYIQVWNYIHKTELLDNFENLKAEIQTFQKIIPLE